MLRSELAKLRRSSAAPLPVGLLRLKLGHYLGKQRAGRDAGATLVGALLEQSFKKKVFYEQKNSGRWLGARYARMN
jgi:hypothetical protein